ncbi:16S rRNA (guanine(966)-N(2))-methyltransferase RsmD [Zooshikella marina]|uniref:16S rRNA (guanine(966)-N(2))-methyltransferase RsmD n=1 Tax=Zooshikella ganghwensis TaxID=202772 RepID=UPI001BB05FB7|nr:16S rRNA (guanine(966)-N(2))-methyltransferase RsmD [Zooshikella ganghwensis]MBU2706368.1 16S rRNA (guanine(966)-N(2))-methyltransferase RsmD [Zooshikella ganghwensis]
MKHRSRKPTSKPQARSIHCHSQLRIIGGQWRSRKLPIADLPGLRPTTDRIRETVFNWLAPYIDGATCLDCFSGTGALTFEALSRGAAWADLLEIAPQANQLLTTNLATLQCKNAQTHAVDCLQWLAKPPTHTYDLVFLDPPFNQGLIPKTIQALLTQPWLKSGALIYIESEPCDLDQLINTAHEDVQHWSLLKSKTTGNVQYCLYQLP